MDVNQLMLICVVLLTFPKFSVLQNVSSDELKIEPKSATLFVGQDISIQCNFPQPLLYCRFLLPGFKKAQRLSIITRPTKIFAYFGQGLDKGDCGITLFAVEENLNGTVGCMVALEDEPDEYEANMTLTVKKPNCYPMDTSDGSQWTPTSCSQVESQIGQECIMTCSAGKVFSGGKNVTCTQKGWLGKNGLLQIPQCKDVAAIAQALIGGINRTLHGIPANMMFVLDESGSISRANFQQIIKFTNSIVHTFPLSPTRSAGIITFDSRANVDVRLDHSDTCTFVKKAKAIKQSRRGTDIRGALNKARNETRVHSSNRTTLVFLVTDGLSYTDPTIAANDLKRHKNVIFCIGIGNFNPQQLMPLSSISVQRIPLFYGIDSFGIFTKVAEYLETSYIHSNQNCP